jgi:hypothetical protein
LHTASQAWAASNGIRIRIRIRIGVGILQKLSLLIETLSNSSGEPPYTL